MPHNFRARDPNYDPYTVSSLLHFAGTSKDFETVRTAIHAAIHAGADLNEPIIDIEDVDTPPIHIAIFFKNVWMVKELIQVGVDVNLRDGDQITPLISAVNSGKVELVRLLLDNGADINARIADYHSALHIAAQLGYVDIAELLIDRGLDVNTRNRLDEIALHRAAQVGKTEIVRLLLDKGSDVNAVSCIEGQHDGKVNVISNNAAIYKASFGGFVEIVDMLIKAGANLHVRSSNGYTPLHAAVMEGHLKLLKMFIKAGANINSQSNRGETPLLSAMGEGKREIVEELLNVEGIDLNLCNDDQETALYRAAGNGHLEIVKLLIMKGAPVNGTTQSHCIPYGSLTPLDIALMQKKENVAEFLIQNGADIHAINLSDGTSVMASACKMIGFYPKLGKLLIEKGGDVNEQCYDGSSLLHFVAEADGDLVESIQFLVERGADVNVQNTKEWTPMHEAANAGNVKIVKYLATKVKEIDSKNFCAQTPLHLAVHRNNYKIAEIFLKNGANPNAQDLSKRTPLHIAMANLGKLETANQNAVNLKDNLKERMPLFSATVNEDEKLVALLLHCGADPNAAMKGGIMPIHLTSNAVANVPIVKALLEKGAYFDVPAAAGSDKLKSSPIKIAQKSGKTEEVSLLELVEKLFDAVIKNDAQEMKCCIQAGAVVNAKNVSGRTALHFAVSNGNIDAVKTLLANGADIGLTSSVSFISKQAALQAGYRLESNVGNTPLHVAVTNKNVEIVKILLTHAKELSFSKYNQVLNAKTTERGAIALHFAAGNDSIDITKLLIEKGAVYNAKNNLNKTPVQLTTDEKVKNLLGSAEKLFQAVKKNSAEEVMQIRENEKSVVNARDSDGGGTPLYWAISKGHTDVANLLLNNNADYCLVTNKGTTPLHMAALKGNVEMVRTLLTRLKNDNMGKANNFINAQTESGSTALHVASSVDVVKCLLEAGATYNILNGKGETPLHSTKNSDIQKLLKITHKLFEDVEKGVSGVINTAKSLKDEEVKAIGNTRNQQGQTLVEVATGNGHIKIASKLLARLEKLR